MLFLSTVKIEKWKAHPDGVLGVLHKEEVNF